MPSSPASTPLSDADISVLELTPTELRLQRERLALESEMLTLERERLAAERKQWQTESEWRGQSSNGMHVSAGILGLAVAFALLLGGLAGFNGGLETGRTQVPLPSKVRVGRHFLQLLKRTVYQPKPSPAVAGPGFDFFALYKRPADAKAAGNLTLVR